MRGRPRTERASRRAKRVERGRDYSRHRGRIIASIMVSGAFDPGSKPTSAHRGERAGIIRAIGAELLRL